MLQKVYYCSRLRYLFCKDSSFCFTNWQILNILLWILSENHINVVEVYVSCFFSATLKYKAKRLAFTNYQFNAICKWSASQSLLLKLPSITIMNLCLEDQLVVHTQWLSRHVNTPCSLDLKPMRRVIWWGWPTIKLLNYRFYSKLLQCSAIWKL